MNKGECRKLNPRGAEGPDLCGIFQVSIRLDKKIGSHGAFWTEKWHEGIFILETQLGASGCLKNKILINTRLWISLDISTWPSHYLCSILSPKWKRLSLFFLFGFDFLDSVRECTHIHTYTHTHTHTHTHILSHLKSSLLVAALSYCTLKMVSKLYLIVLMDGSPSPR